MGARDDTVALLDRLRRHYIDPDEAYPGGVFLTETGWNGGTHPTRADALYVGFTSTRGRHLVGHEVKVSRADWQRELDHPGKADPWHDACHAWYVVAPSTAVVDPSEVPHGWGLLVVNPRTDRRLKTVVKPALHPDRQPPWDAVRSLLARQDTLARGREQALRRQVQEEARAQYEDLVAALRGRQMTAQVEARLRALDQLEAALGVTVTAHAHSTDPATPTAAQVAAALKLVQAPAHMPAPHLLDNVDRRLRQTLTHLDELRDAVAALAEGTGSPPPSAP